MARMKYKEITKILLKKLDNAGCINCYRKERDKTCEWNEKAKYDDKGINCLNDKELEEKQICVKCLLKDIENVIKE